MTTSKATATLRVPLEVRDEIARMAKQRHTTMVDVVTDAVHLLGRDEWWASVRDALDEMSPEQAAEYQAESELWDAASADGLHER